MFAATLLFGASPLPDPPDVVAQRRAALLRLHVAHVGRVGAGVQEEDRKPACLGTGCVLLVSPMFLSTCSSGFVTPCAVYVLENGIIAFIEGPLL